MVGRKFIKRAVHTAVFCMVLTMSTSTWAQSDVSYDDIGEPTNTPKMDFERPWKAWALTFVVFVGTVALALKPSKRAKVD